MTGWCLAAAKFPGPGLPPDIHTTLFYNPFPVSIFPSGLDITPHSVHLNPPLFRNDLPVAALMMIICHGSFQIRISHPGCLMGSSSVTGLWTDIVVAAAFTSVVTVYG